MDIKELLVQAQDEPKRSERVNMTAYGEIANMLREKGLRYRDIVSWFSERGVVVNIHNITQACVHWQKNNGLRE